MMRYWSKLKTKGFTIVELIVIVAVVGILAGVVIIGYGAWNRSISEAAAESELQSVEGAMKQYRNFNNGYSTTIPSTFQPSDHVTVRYMSGNATGYCIRATSTRVTSVVRYLQVTGDTSKISSTAC